MKTFYLILIVIGVLGMVLGGWMIYVGQSKVLGDGAMKIAAAQYELSELKSEIKYGKTNSRSELADKIYIEERAEAIRSHAMTGMLIGLVVAVVGLLMTLFSRAKYKEIKQKSAPS